VAERRLHRVAHLCRHRYVGGNEQRPTPRRPDVGGGPFSGDRVAVGDHHPRPLAGEEQRGLPADAASPTGDQCHPPFEAPAPRRRVFVQSVSSVLRRRRIIPQAEGELRL
jgi:hypothetical protein